jgi:hypothetical protein
VSKDQPNNPKSRQHRLSPIVLGTLLLAAAILANEWTLAMLASDGNIESGLIKNALRAFNVAAFVLGLLFLKFRSRHLVQRLSALLFLASYSAVASLLIVFALLEAFPSVATPLANAGIPYYAARVAMGERYVIDPELVWRYKPNLKIEIADWRGDQYDPALGIAVPALSYRATFDGDGFRNVSPPAFSDAVVLGDSFAEMGVDDDDTFAERLAKVSGFKTRNLGLGFYGPYQYLAAFKRFGLPLRPRVAVFCFFEGNDILDIQRYGDWRTHGTYGSFRNLAAMSFFQRFIMAMSDLSVFVQTALMKAINRHEVTPAQAAAAVVELKLGEATVAAAFGYRGDPRPPAVLLASPEWRALSGILQEFKSAATASQVVPIVVFIPSKMHIYGPYATDRSSQHWLRMRDSELASLNNIEQTMVQTAGEVGLPLISLTPRFAALASQSELLYYPFDSHWNSRGRQVAAELVAGELEKLVLPR